MDTDEGPTSDAEGEPLQVRQLSPSLQRMQYSRRPHYSMHGGFEAA